MIPEEELISWYRPDTEVFEAAAKDESALVLYFPGEDLDPIDASRELHDAELAKLSDGNVTFVMIEHNSDRTPSFDDGSPVPTSKLLSPNPSRDYDIQHYPSFIVCDWFGNEYVRHTKVPSAKSLMADVEKVADSMAGMNEKLAGNLEDATKALEGKDVKKFLKAVNKNFKYGVVGLSAQEDTIKLYRKLMDDTRADVESLLSNRPEDAEKRLKDLSKDFRDTEIEEEIKDALDIVKG